MQLAFDLTALGLDSFVQWIKTSADYSSNHGTRAACFLGYHGRLQLLLLVERSMLVHLSRGTLPLHRHLLSTSCEDAATKDLDVCVNRADFQQTENTTMKVKDTIKPVGRDLTLRWKERAGLR